MKFYNEITSMKLASTTEQLKIQAGIAALASGLYLALLALPLV